MKKYIMVLWSIGGTLARLKHYDGFKTFFSKTAQKVEKVKKTKESLAKQLYNTCKIGVIVYWLVFWT